MVARVVKTSLSGAVLASLILAAVCWAAEQPRPEARSPNVLLILADDLGYGDLSSYGAEDLATPHIDRLVAGGMRLSRFYANSPVCSPTRAALLTGRYPDAVGVPGVIRTHAHNSWGYLSPDAVLLPALLKKAGYRTAMVGKWHLGLGEPNLPNSRGFDFFHGFLGDMMDDYWTHRRHGFNYMRLNAETVDPKGHATDVFTDWACQWLKQYQEPAPFLLYLAYNAPHDPIQPPPDWLKKYRAKHPEVSEKRAKLAALIEHLDDGVGRVLAALKETGRADNTLIFFTSDNGGSLPAGANNGPLNNGKGTMFEGGMRVPMCAAWPGRIKPGSHSDRVALMMDLFPTICQAAGAGGLAPFAVQRPASGQTVPVPFPIDGRSLLPTLLGKPQPPDDRFLFWVRREGGPYRGGACYAVRRGDWKALQLDPNERLRLYNLEKDPGETTDLAAREAKEYAELKRALEKHIDRCALVSDRPPGGIGPGEIDNQNPK